MIPVSRWNRVLPVVVAVVVAVAIQATPSAAHSGRDSGRWTGAWAASMLASYPDFYGEKNWSAGFTGQSVRQVIRVSRGGSAVRIRLSNVHGTTALRLAGASIGKAGQGAAVRPGSLRPVTFGHSLSTVIPAGREAVSDAALVRVSPLERLTVTLYFAEPTGPSTFHLFSTATSYRTAGDHRFDRDSRAFAETSQSWYYLAGVDVAGQNRDERGAVVTFGDSLTDGTASTTDADNRYPDELAERLAAAGRPMGVLNAGVGGNRLLNDTPGCGQKATARFGRDVLGLPGVRTVIVMEGLNDIGISEGGFGEKVTGQQLIDGHRALIRAAHARGIRVIGATLTPTKGTFLPGYYTESGEAMREKVNAWIRHSGEYDAVADFERAVADPSDPDQLRQEYNGGDGLHLNDAGMRALAQAVDLATL
jgi:lysophospholipase L1-like esterase